MSRKSWSLKVGFIIYEDKVKSSRPDLVMAFQLVKVYDSCLCTHLINLYDKLQLIRSSSLCKLVFAVHVLHAFVKMDKLEYCMVIKFFILDGLSSEEIHLKLTKVYRNCAPLVSTVKRWAWLHIVQR